MNRRRFASALALWLSVSAFGCEEAIVKGKAPAEAAAVPDAGAAAGDAAPLVPDFQEVSFGEGEQSRDPFRSYARSFVEEARSGIRSQREVLLNQYAVDELRLVGIVTRIHPAKAMLVDPAGVGHVVQRGQFVGRPEVVQASGTASPQEINWRIDRIRDGDLVLVREDPTNPDVPSATRVIPLRPEANEPEEVGSTE
jgi:type IV pilus assembly protein PilP